MGCGRSSILRGICCSLGATTAGTLVYQLPIDREAIYETVGDEFLSFLQKKTRNEREIGNYWRCLIDILEYVYRCNRLMHDSMPTSSMNFFPLGECPCVATKAKKKSLDNMSYGST